MDEDLFELTLDEIREKQIPQMPATLREALEGLIADNDFLKPVFTEDMIDTINIINLKDKFGQMKLDQLLLNLNQLILVNNIINKDIKRIKS
jgi:glutamine synthetase